MLLKGLRLRRCVWYGCHMLPATVMASSNSGQQLCWAQGSSACRRIVHADIRGYQSLISSPGTYDKGFLRHHLKKTVENESNGGVNSLLFTLFTSFVLSRCALRGGDFGTWIANKVCASGGGKLANGWMNLVKSCHGKGATTLALDSFVSQLDLSDWSLGCSYGKPFGPKCRVFLGWLPLRCWYWKLLHLAVCRLKDLNWN